MGWENIFTIRVDNYNPFCNKNMNSNKTVRNEKRKYIILNRVEVLHLCILFYDYKIDLNTTGFDTIEWSVFLFEQNLSNYCIPTK